MFNHQAQSSRRPSINWCGILLGIVMLLQQPSFSSATTVIVLANDKQVIIAADSKSTDIGKDGSTAHTSCKIYPVKKMVCAFAGLVSIHDEQGSSFDAARLLRTIAQESKEPRDTVAMYTKTVKETLARNINIVWEKTPEKIQDYPILFTVFVMFENGRSVVLFRNFRIPLDRSSDQIEVVSGEEVPPETQRLRFFMGTKQEIIEYVSRHPDSWLKPNIETAINHLIGLEAEIHPDKVGFPVDILHFTANGGRWLQGGAECWNLDL